MNPHEHDWIITRDRSPDGLLTFRRECQICGEVQYRKTREETGAAWTTTRPTHGHDHKWGSIRRNRMNGEMYRRCLDCGVEQNGGEAIRPEVVRTDSLRTTPSPLASRLGEHGGVVKYDPATEVITMLDGSRFVIEELARANPGVHHGELHTELMKFAPKPKEPYTFTPEQLEAVKKMIATTASGAEEMAEAMAALGKAALAVGTPYPEVSINLPPKPWTSEDALTLILEEIKHDPDPLAAAGKWITKVTNGITDITRNLDDQ